MSARGPADTPPPHEGAGPEALPPDASAAPAPGESGATPEPSPSPEGPSPVLSLDDRKAERRRRREAEEAALADMPKRQAKLLRMEGRRNGRGAGGNLRARALDPAARGDLPSVPHIRTPATGAASPIGPARRFDDEDDDGFALNGAILTGPAPRPAGPARTRRRHWAVIASFLLLVLLPTAIVSWYLWERASPRYASSVGFSVRTEEPKSALDMLGGMVALGSGGSSSSDTDILYRYIQSQEIVQKLDAELDLRALWSKGDPEHDPVFAYHAPGTIEDLLDYWGRMVSVYNDTGTGLLDVEVQAFTPEDAQAIAQAIYAESQRLINQLSDVAQSDKTRLAREELDDALERLKTARAALTRFRNENQIVDPSASLQTQMGLLARLQDQLAQTLIELDLLRQSAPDDDPRVQQSLARVDVIQARIDEERAKLGLGRDESAGNAGDGPEAASDGAFANIVGDYERLQVDQEFAQQSYVAAMAAYDAALAAGRQQSRYLAAHLEPTLAERAEYPQRWTLTLLTALFATLAWMVLVLGAYALKDRR